jgi:hypothetical protein
MFCSHERPWTCTVHSGFRRRVRCELRAQMSCCSMAQNATAARLLFYFTASPCAASKCLARALSQPWALKPTQRFSTFQVQRYSKRGPGVDGRVFSAVESSGTLALLRKGTCCNCLTGQCICNIAWIQISKCSINA